jgi:hypothetical protein
MKNFGSHLLLAIAILIGNQAQSQPVSFEYEKTPMESGFKMEGYWVWCGSVIKVDSMYHLFASRWPKTGPFPEGYKTHSEIVRATSKSPLGPYRFEEVVIGERDSSFWDSNMAHNPTIQKIGNEYVLFYIGSDFTTCQDQSTALLRRVGYATAKSIYGPWVRSDRPVIATESNNPALLVDHEGVKLMYRNAKLRIFIAEAKTFRGPYQITNDNVWPACRLEDYYLFRADHQYHMICEDNTGGVSGHERWGIHLCSANGTDDWQKYPQVVVYNHDIRLTNDSILHLVRRERPQLLIENHEITHLVTSVYDGKDAWSQPVKLKLPIRVE